MSTAITRTEHDLLGNREVPADAYYGIHTLRAVENFPVTGTPISHYPELIRALAQIKMAAARANHDLGLLNRIRTDAIVEACREIEAGRLHDQFVVDVIQGGAGTSTNMNANEVIANRALEILGHERGDYLRLHPNEHVNMSQSTNDVYPTALKVATYMNPDKGFSGCCFELIAGLKIELGLERVDLVGGDGRDDVNEGVDCGSMLGQIEGRELLDMADDGLGHVPGIEQSFILQR